jgi:SAM-dependent methyltransferase
MLVSAPSMPSLYSAQRRLRERLLRSPSFRRLIARLPSSARTGALAKIFLAFPMWQREVMIEDTARELDQLGPQTLSAVEVSGRFWHRLPWRSYTNLYFPEFDLCDPPADLPGPFDVVLCEQVLEHVEDPLTAVDTLRRLCKPDGHVFVSTPFLIRVHGSPGDFWRFTPSGCVSSSRHEGWSRCGSAAGATAAQSQRTSTNGRVVCLGNRSRTKRIFRSRFGPCRVLVPAANARSPQRYRPITCGKLNRKNVSRCTDAVALGWTRLIAPPRRPSPAHLSRPAWPGVRWR